MSVPPLFVFISTNSHAYNGRNNVLNRVLYMYKMREIPSLIFYVRATLKVLWDCETKDAIEIDCARYRPTQHSKLLLKEWSSWFYL